MYRMFHASPFCFGFECLSKSTCGYFCGRQWRSAVLCAGRSLGLCSPLWFVPWLWYTFRNMYGLLTFVRHTSFLFAAIVLALSAVSCSQPNTALQEESDTLRTTAEALDRDTFWADELESSVLTARLSGADGIDSSVPVSPKTVAISVQESGCAPVYPEVEGFASLDVSALSEGALRVLNRFCAAVIAEEPPFELMADGRTYVLSLFLYDLSRLPRGRGFGRYVLGKPFVSDELCQCPVRFFYKAESQVKAATYKADGIDFFLYVVQEDGEWKIQQIVYGERRETHE